MGTNYYLHRNVCEHCGRSDERLHIGKSSAGWCFSLHVDEYEVIRSLDDWRARFAAGGEIRDEYGEVVTVEQMLSTITERGREPWSEQRKRMPFGYGSWEEFHRHNGSKEGPKGLLRHHVDGRHCVGNGEGTWDLITGEFS